MTDHLLDKEFSRVFREAKYQEFDIPKKPGTMNFWHGGNLDEYDDVMAQRAGRYEYGPGLYLTTHFDTAKKYAKGGRRMYLVTVKKGTELSEAKFLLSQAVAFVNEFAMASKRHEIRDFLADQAVDGRIPATFFLNELVNQKAVRPSNTSELRKFLVDNGVDYELVFNPFGWGETMMVLYNMAKIDSYRVYGPKDQAKEYDLTNDF